MRTIFATVADLRAFSGTTIPPSQEAYCLSNGTAALGGSGGPQRMIWLPGSTTPDNNQGQLAVLPTTGSASGRWIRRDPAFDLLLPVTFANTDNQQLVLVPAEMTLLPVYAGIFLEVSTAWGGGATPTIGLSFTNGTVTRTKGNLAGGAAGNGAFTYVTYRQMTLGSQYSIATGTVDAIVLGPGSTILFDRITDAYTSGAGNFHIPVYNFFTGITAVPPP
jgi:hypothetical protein